MKEENENITKLLIALKLLDIKVRHVFSDSITVDGINGQVSSLREVADIKQHFIQMGRDSLKMELHNLLDITKHN